MCTLAWTKLALPIRTLARSPTISMPRQAAPSTHGQLLDVANEPGSGLSVNGNLSQPVPVFYTVGWWNETQPLEVTLVKGHNNLNFTRSTERTITFKSFVLHNKKPDVPAPFPPYTPSPTPPPSAYHQVPPTTTCEKQGITAVPVSECPRACTALGLNYGGQGGGDRHAWLHGYCDGALQRQLHVQH